MFEDIYEGFDIVCEFHITGEETSLNLSCFIFCNHQTRFRLKQKNAN